MRYAARSFRHRRYAAFRCCFVFASIDYFAASPLAIYAAITLTPPPFRFIAFVKIDHFDDYAADFFFR